MPTRPIITPSRSHPEINQIDIYVSENILVWVIIQLRNKVLIPDQNIIGLQIIIN